MKHTRFCLYGQVNVASRACVVFRINHGNDLYRPILFWHYNTLKAFERILSLLHAVLQFCVGIILQLSIYLFPAHFTDNISIRLSISNGQINHIRHKWHSDTYSFDTFFRDCSILCSNTYQQHISCKSCIKYHQLISNQSYQWTWNTWFERDLLRLMTFFFFNKLNEWRNKIQLFPFRTRKRKPLT